MNDEMKTETMELCVTACEKFASNNEVNNQNCQLFKKIKKLKIGSYTYLKGAARMIKETLDKKFGPAWHVIVGEGYGFEITHEVKNLLYMFFGGTQAILLWKCA